MNKNDSSYCDEEREQAKCRPLSCLRRKCTILPKCKGNFHDWFSVMSHEVHLGFLARSSVPRNPIAVAFNLSMLTNWYRLFRSRHLSDSMAKLPPNNRAVSIWFVLQKVYYCCTYNFFSGGRLFFDA
jgi:hypothetical protein